MSVVSKTSNISKNDLLPLKDVSKLFSYSRDYLAKLARDKKINAVQIDRQWFVDVISLQNFIEISALEKEVRSKFLSDERRNELNAKKNLKQINLNFKKQIERTHSKSLSVAILVLTTGLFFGFFININDYLTFKIFNHNLLAQVYNQDNFNVSNQSLETSNENADEILYPLFATESEIIDMEAKDGILIFNDETDLSEMEDIKKLFSDNLTIDQIDEKNGLVNLINSDGETKEIPFVIISQDNNSEDNKP